MKSKSCSTCLVPQESHEITGQRRNCIRQHARQHRMPEQHSGVRAQDLGSTVARFQASLLPGSHAANPNPSPSQRAHVPALLIALRGGDGSSSPRAGVPEAPGAELPARGPSSPEPPARLRLGQGARPSGGARTASRLPWVLGAEPDPGSLDGGKGPAADPDAAPPSCGKALGTGECTRNAHVAAPACPAAACHLLTCSDDEDMEARQHARVASSAGLP